MTNLKMIVVSLCLMIGGSVNAAELVKFDIDFCTPVVSDAPIVFDLDFGKGCGCGCPECICSAGNCAGDKCPCKCGTCPCHAGKVSPLAVTNLNVGAIPQRAYSVKICVNKAPKVTEPVEMTYSVSRQVYTVSPNYRNRWTWPGMSENSLRSHLIRTHGLPMSTVYASNFGELKALHDEAHGTRVIRSYAKTVQVARPAKTVELQATVNKITTARASSCPGGNCPGGSTTTYGRTYSSGSSCPGGNCPGTTRSRGWGWFR